MKRSLAVLVFSAVLLAQAGAQQVTMASTMLDRLLPNRPQATAVFGAESEGGSALPAPPCSLSR